MIIINNYTYKTCGKIISTRIGFIIPANDFPENLKYIAYKNLTMIRQFLLTNNTNNVFLEVKTVNSGYKKPVYFYVNGFDIPKFLEL